MDDSGDNNLLEVNNHIKELERQRENILKISIESKEVNSNALDQHLIANQESIDELLEYRGKLDAERNRAKTFEENLGGIANRLRILQDRIEEASFEEKRRAVKELVKRISVFSENVNGTHKPIVTITFRFNDPIQNYPDPIPAVLPYHTAGRAAITVDNFVSVYSF